MRQAGIIIEPPNINTSSYTFTPNVEENKIIYGLSGILNVGEDVIRSIIDKKTDKIYNKYALGGMAQLVERLVRNEEASGSNPLTSTTQKGRQIAVLFISNCSQLYPYAVCTGICTMCNLFLNYNCSARISSNFCLAFFPINAPSSH